MIVSFAVFPGGNSAFKAQTNLDLYRNTLSTYGNYIKVIKDTLDRLKFNEKQPLLFRLARIKEDLEIFGKILNSPSKANRDRDFIGFKLFNVINGLKNTEFKEKRGNMIFSFWELMGEPARITSISKVKRP